MSENEKNLEPELPAFVKKAPELIPLWDWWVKEGRSTAIMVAVAGLAVAAFYGTRNWMKGRDAAASAALVKMASPNAPGGGLVDEQEEAVATYGSTKAGPKMKIVLAKSYFDAERYEDALQVYDELVKDAGKNQDMADIAAVGRAQALEGIASQDESEDGRKAKYKAASEAFADYVATHEKSYLLLDAKLGAARCKALSGDKDGATADFAALTENAKDEAEKSHIKRVEDAVKRYKPRARASLLDVANSAAAQLEKEKKADAKPEAKPTVPEAPKAAPKVEAKQPATKPAVTAAPKPAPKADAKPAAPAAPKADAKPAAPAAAKPAPKADAKPAK